MPPAPREAAPGLLMTLKTAGEQGHDHTLYHDLVAIVFTRKVDTWLVGICRLYPMSDTAPLLA